LDVSGLLDSVPPELNLLFSALALVLTFVVYKSLSRFLSRTGARLELEPHALNAIRLVLRVAAIAVALSVLLGIWNLPTEWFIGGSALIGAAIGFGSSQTINNVVAGFYVLVTQPFKVKDYVKIGDLEGQVEEISINYTSLYTPTFNLLKVPNTQVMNSRILNMTHEGFIKYTFTVNFGYDYPNETIMERVIQPAIREFHESGLGEDFRVPEAYVDSVDRLSRVFLIRFFIPKGEARRLYALKPEFMKMIADNYDELKKA